MRDRQGSRNWRRGPEWPAWAEPLRPDELTRRRLHKRVMAAAESMLRIPVRTWQDETARWSAVLTPVAAGLAVAFGMLAYRASAALPTASVAAGEPPTVETIEIRPVFGMDVEAPPVLLIDTSELNREAVLSAALVSR